MATERIPLFPLDVVLFPTAPLPLHIFEPRYKLMVRRCLDTQREFGVILARKDGIAAVGCTAEIIKVLHTYPDGRMDILTIGQNPFRVEKVFEDEAYFEAAVEFLADAAGAGATENERRLRELYEKCHTLVHGRAPGAIEGGFSLSYQIAGGLPFDLEARQTLLEIRSEAERQEKLLAMLEELLPKLAPMNRMQARAGGNGQGRN